MKSIFLQFSRKHRAFTLAELAIAMVLMSFVVFLAGGLINLSSVAFTGTEVQTGIIREESAFAAKLNEAIQESTVSFTVPQRSFNNVDKLTAGWNYLGLMDNVRIPQAASRTGKEIASAQALVYIEYMGDTRPASIPSDCNLISNAEGFFLQKIIAHAFTDSLGITHSYSLEFKPTNPANAAAQSIIYEFSANADKDGGAVGGGTDLDIDTMLNCLNAIQVVYKGGSNNPAVALAFRSDFMPTWSAQQASTSKPAATIVMVLDLSSSMTASFGRTTRIQALKESAVDFVEQFSSNDKINIIVVPFSNVGCEPGCYKNKSVPVKHIYNASSEKEALKTVINGLNAYDCTNPGDGIRVGYVLLKQHRNSGAELGQCFMILMTDGMMNEMTSLTGRKTDPYYGEDILTGNYTWYGWPSSNSSAKCVYDYVEYWGNKVVNEFHTTNYLIGMNGSMNNKDGALLKKVFSTETLNVDNLSEFTTVWEEIGANIDEVIWAFEGPNL